MRSGVVGAPSDYVTGTEASGRRYMLLRTAAGFYSRRREQLLYLAFGAWNTAFGYGTWAILQFAFGEKLPYLVILVLAWPIAVLNAYIVYRYFVFRSHGRILSELPRFSLVYFLTLIANLALLPVALLLLPLNIYVVQGIFLAVVVIASYLAHRHFSFGPRGSLVPETRAEDDAVRRGT